MLSEPYLEADMPRSQKIKSLLSILSDAYNTYADDDEAYLAVDFVDEGDVILGTEDPQAILDASVGWNAKIMNNLHEAISEYLTASKGNNGAALNAASVYALKKAAMAADDDFYSFAEDALYIPAEKSHALYFRTVLSAADRMGIRARPESYALLEVGVK